MFRVIIISTVGFSPIKRTTKLSCEAEVCQTARVGERKVDRSAPILSVFPALTVHSELKSVHPGFPVALIF